MRKKSKGFTVVEAVMALAVLGMLLIPLSKALLDSLQTERYAEAREDYQKKAVEVLREMSEGYYVDDKSEYISGLKSAQWAEVAPDKSAILYGLMAKEVIYFFQTGNLYRYESNSEINAMPDVAEAQFLLDHVTLFNVTTSGGEVAIQIRVEDDGNGIDLAYNTGVWMRNYNES